MSDKRTDKYVFSPSLGQRGMVDDRAKIHEKPCVKTSGVSKTGGRAEEVLVTLVGLTRLVCS